MDLWDCMRGKKRKRSGVKSGGKEKRSLVTQVQPVNDGYQSVMDVKVVQMKLIHLKVGKKKEKKMRK